MARPHKPIQRRSNGNYYVRLNANGRRLTKSLETKDPQVAAKRASQALEELEREAAGPQQPRWKADLVGIEGDVPVQLLDYVAGNPPFKREPLDQRQVRERQVVVTNSIPIPGDRVFPQLKVLSVANMLGEAIWRIHEESSVSSMFR